MSGTAHPLHYTCNEVNGFTLYSGNQPLMIVKKHYQMVDIAKDCLLGKLVIPASPDPIVIVDHLWLLRLASELSAVAAYTMEQNPRV